MDLYSHHAWLYRGNREDIPVLQEYLKTQGVNPIGNADVHMMMHDTAGVDEVRHFLHLSRRRPLRDAHVVSVLVAATVTREAQNALLKTFEEPTEHALYILVTPHPQQLLPTLRSRTHTLPHQTSDAPSTQDARSFLQSPASERLETIKKMLGSSSDERDVHALHSFLNALEHEASALVMTQTDREGIRALYDAKRALYEPGSAVKPLCEAMALLMPTVR